jgi:hypothetical protein
LIEASFQVDFRAASVFRLFLVAKVHQDAFAVFKDDLAGIAIANWIKNDSMCHVAFSVSSLNVPSRSGGETAPQSPAHFKFQSCGGFC